MVLIGSGVGIEANPPVSRMDDARRELDAAVLQAKRHCLQHIQGKDAENSELKRYIYAVTVMRKDHFFSLHSGRRSRSLTRVYVEQREDRARSAHPALPKKSDFVEDNIEDGSLRLEWHETIEGRKADVVEDDKTAVAELESHLPVEYHEWQHDFKVHSEEISDSTTAVSWRVGDHLFSYEEPFDLSVDLPDRVHFFFTGEHLPERRRRYNSLPNLLLIDLSSESALNKDHSHHSLYGHGFRQLGQTIFSRTMESLDESRLQMGARPSLHGKPHFFQARTPSLLMSARNEKIHDLGWTSFSILEDSNNESPIVGSLSKIHLDLSKRELSPIFRVKEDSKRKITPFPDHQEAPIFLEDEVMEGLAEKSQSISTLIETIRKKCSSTKETEFPTNIHSKTFDDPSKRFLNPSSSNLQGEIRRKITPFHDFSHRESLEIPTNLMETLEEKSRKSSSTIEGKKQEESQEKTLDITEDDDRLDKTSHPLPPEKSKEIYTEVERLSFPITSKDADYSRIVPKSQRIKEISENPADQRGNHCRLYPPPPYQEPQFSPKIVKQGIANTTFKQSNEMISFINQAEHSDNPAPAKPPRIPLELNQSPIEPQKGAVSPFEKEYTLMEILKPKEAKKKGFLDRFKKKKEEKQVAVKIHPEERPDLYREQPEIINKDATSNMRLSSQHESVFKGWEKHKKTAEIPEKIETGYPEISSKDLQFNYFKAQLEQRKPTERSVHSSREDGGQMEQSEANPKHVRMASIERYYHSLFGIRPTEEKEMRSESKQYLVRLKDPSIGQSDKPSPKQKEDHFHPLSEFESTNRRHSSLHDSLLEPYYKIKKLWLQSPDKRRCLSPPPVIVYSTCEVLSHEEGIKEIPLRIQKCRKRSSSESEVETRARADEDNIKTILKGVTHESSHHTAESHQNISSAGSLSSIYRPIPIVVYEKGTSYTNLQHVGHFTEQVPEVETIEHVNESMVVQPPSPEHSHSADHFVAEFNTRLANVGEIVKEVIHREEPIYDQVYEEERIYGHVAHERHSPPPPVIPISPLPHQDDTLHYAAVAVATGDDDSHLYKDDENIYEDIDAQHIIESAAYAEPHIYETPKDSASLAHEHEYSEVVKHHNEYSEVAREAVHKDYDENGNHDEHILVRTPEFSESSRAVFREVKPYLGSPTFNKLQKKFYPEDLAERERQYEKGGDIVVQDHSVLDSPTTIVTNNGITEIEDRAYDKNHYDDAQTLVIQSPADENSARATVAIRRMSKNNRWSEDELESPKIRVSLDAHIPLNSPFVKPISPLASPRSPSISPVPPKISPSPSPRVSSISPVPPRSIEINELSRPGDLHLKIDVGHGSESISPVERVVSLEVKSPHSPVEFYQSGFVKERRKLFENGTAPPLPGYTTAKRQEARTSSYARNAATVRLERVKESPVEVSTYKVHEPVISPEVQLRKTVIESQVVPSPIKSDENSNRRKSVLEMRREYEASLQHSQPNSTTASPQRSRTNSRRRTLEVQIGSGVALTQTPPPKYTEVDESSDARRTVHRTIQKAMHQGVASASITASIGGGVQVSASLERHHDEGPVIGGGVQVSHEHHHHHHHQAEILTPSTSADVHIGTGAVIRSIPSPTPSVAAVRIGTGAGPTAASQLAEPLVLQPSLTVEFPLVIAKPIQVEEVRESTTAVEEEPTPLQRNGSGRRSWPVKTYENNIRFDNQKLKMPDVDYTSSNGHITNGIEKINGEEHAVLKDWDPRALVRALYEVSYEPRLETKRNRFFTMEGHVEVPSKETNTLAELEREWKSQYMRVKEGRLQIFVTHCAGEAPAEEIVLSGCDVDANREERTLIVHGGKDKIRLLLRVPSAVFDKWRQALLSHAASSQIDAYVKPVHRTLDHLSERVVIIEIGSCSIRGGRLTQEPSLPQSFFPAIGIRTDDGKIIVGEDAFTPAIRHRGEFVRPIQSDPAVERYTMDQEVVKTCMNKVVHDLNIDPKKYKVLLSIPQNIPIVLISELVTIALKDIKFQGAAITRQPSLILYAYDVTTGVVVDIGDRLNIVPVIDGYVVDSATCSIPYGATQVREALRSDLCANNKGLYSFQSPIEKLILRYVMEQACYVPEDYQKEEKSKDVNVSLDQFNPTSGMQSKFSIDSSRFTCTEGLFRPKKWGLDTKGLHQLVHEAVQMSPIDSRRNLYRNIFLAGGASLLPGLAEKLEQELASIVPNTIHTQVHISPWRYNAAYLGAQVVASSSTFEDQCVTAENLQQFLINLSTSAF